MVNITTPLLIIGAALPRTGTTSLLRALEQLGYRVWHATTWSPAMTPIWFNITQADIEHDPELFTASFDQFVHQLSDEGFNATLDQPSCFVYEQLMKYYPDAKVLNTERNPASWARSMVEMAYSLDLLVWQPPYSLRENAGKGPWGNWSKQQLGFHQDEIYPLGVPFNGTNHLETKSSISLKSGEAAYHRYQNKVKARVPSEKLVHYNVKEGWEPLCQHFLPPNKSCPDDKPFPHVNSREDGFLLDFRIKASVMVQLYKLHPLLARQWLANAIAYLVKRKRTIPTFLAAVSAIYYILLKG